MKSVDISNNDTVVSFMCTVDCEATHTHCKLLNINRKNTGKKVEKNK